MTSRKDEIDRIRKVLCLLAEDKTILNSDRFSTQPVVMSPLVEHMLSPIEFRRAGSARVVCARSNSGKTRAAHFLMNGNYPYRPERSLLLSAAGMNDFATDFASSVGAPKEIAPRLYDILCDALRYKRQDVSSVVQVVLSSVLQESKRLSARSRCMDSVKSNQPHLAQFAN